MSSTSKPVHLSQLDFIRAFASLWVAVYHLSGKKYLIGTYGYLGVPIFFVLSGFVICWSLPDDYRLNHLKTFLSKRIIRIEPPYLMSIVLVLLINVLVARMSGAVYHIDIKNVLLHLSYLNNFTGCPYLNSVYWTLGIEFQFYLLIGFLFPLLLGARWFVWLILLAFSLSPLLASGLPFDIIFKVANLFALGVAACLYKKDRISCNELIILIILNTGLCLYTQGLPTTLAGIATLFLIFKFNYTHAIIRFFALISFSLYLVHDIVGSKLSVVMSNLFLNKTLLIKLLIFCTSLSVSILAAYTFYLVIERPFSQLSKRIIYGKNSLPLIKSSAVNR